MLRSSREPLWRRAFWLTILILTGSTMEAASPRWTTGPPYFTVSNTAVVWYTNQPEYYTDPGDLSAYVNHAAADAMVAAAAGVWNVPVASLVLQQGGTLDEHVSGANVYVGSDGLVFPSDVQSTNYTAKQIAIIYDRDGSVTDLLLGSGASDPTGCRQNGVTEDVDSISPSGYIQHAVLILNGLCTGPDPEQQLQMQYQLERAFGRILGLGWSQLNDNVFTGSPAPTYAQALHWPIMHPIDIICGLYTYQCLPQPFTLRDDDIASLVMLYSVSADNVPPGKQQSYTQSSSMDGAIWFPSQTVGMAGVNVVLRRNWTPQQVMETFYDVSAVTGIYKQQSGGNPITPQAADLLGSLGDASPLLLWGWWWEDVRGYFKFPWIPIPAGQAGQDILMQTEPINPLYTGEYAIGPYTSSTVEPSGSTVSWRINYDGIGWYGYFDEIASDAPSTCDGGDGTESSPIAPAASGWWMGVLCGPTSNNWSDAHSSWINLPIRANRSFTLEVTALDEQGSATVNKARPVIGVWNSTDALGTEPTVAAAPAAFNGNANGMTALGVQSSQANTFRVAISDERGDGRPDYAYQSRVLYADSIAPATGSIGSQVTIAGMGFRAGNTVTIGGIAAKVTSWSSTQITASVPLLGSVAPGTSANEDVVVTDPTTEGSTVMSGAFQYVYTVPAYTLALIASPSGSLPINLQTTSSFTVKAIDVDGVTPMAGVPVIFSATVGSVSWGACGTATCTVLTDAQGLATTTVIPTAIGAVTLQAAALGLTQQVSFLAIPLIRTVTVSPTNLYLAAGATVNWSLTANAQQQGLPATLTPIAWSSLSGGLVFSQLQSVTDLLGNAQSIATIGPLAGGTQASGSVCAWLAICAGFSAQGVDPTQFSVRVTSGAGQSVSATQSFSPLTIEITDSAGDPVAGANVQVHQTVSQWTAPCPVQGRCPDAPVYQTSNTTITTGLDGSATITPLQISGAEVTDMVITSGSQGFVSLSLQKQPQ